MAYDKGAANTFRQYNFTSFQELHKPDNESELVKPFNNTLTGIWDLAGAKKATTATEYSWWEKNRIMPLVKATTVGALAGATAKFVTAAASQTSFGSYSPYNTGTTATTAALPVRKYDIISIAPQSGLASAGSYVNAIVISINSAQTEFDARPLVSTDSIPAIASAAELIIIGNAFGEGSVLSSTLSTTTTKYTENLQIVKHRYQVTGTDKLAATWVDLGKGMKAFLPAEKDAYMQFLKLQDLTLLLGEQMSSVALSDDFIDGTLETNAPIRTTNGLIKQVLTGGQILDYSNITGVTLADLWDYNTIIDKEGAEKENMLHLGIDIDQQLDRELGDRVANGAISYGNFKFGEAKAIDLQFSKMKLGSFVYNKRCLEALNDRQNTGAEGYGYSYEALMLPMGSDVKLGNDDESGKRVATVRKRFLANYGESREAVIKYYDGFAQSENGTDRDEVRYMAEIGVEVQARNKTGYWRRS